MNEQDKKRFAEIWGAALETGGRDASVPMLRLAFSALAEFPLAQVERALAEHVTKSRFPPTPADIRAIIEASTPGGRPGVEEGWAIAIGAKDEGATVVWTEEIAAAWGVAQPILAAGDEIAARMAFKEAYQRAVDAAKRAGRPVRWTPSLGHDPQARAVALEQAVAQGQLGRDAVAHLLPAPVTADGAAIAGLLGHDAPEPATATVRAHLAAIRKRIQQTNRGQSDEQEQ